MGMFYGHLARGTWEDARQANIIDGGAHFYNVYPCKDGKWIALGAIEPQFYAALVRLAGLEDPAFEIQGDRARWPELKEKVAAVIVTRTRAEWMAALEGTDACAAPVMSLAEAPQHPHNVARGSFVEVDGVTQPAPAPRFSKTPGAVQRSPAEAASLGEQALRDWAVERA
jgi:alpha-methylacyl-CoA racemase